MSSFETSEEHGDPGLRPLRVASRKEGIYEQAKEMVADLRGWQIAAADDASLVLQCERKGGLLSPSARVVIRVEGPEGIPSAVVHVRSESRGGLLARDKSNVLEFMRPFTRRVC